MEKHRQMKYYFSSNSHFPSSIYSFSDACFAVPFPLYIMHAHQLISLLMMAVHSCLLILFQITFTFFVNVIRSLIPILINPHPSMTLINLILELQYLVLKTHFGILSFHFLPEFLEVSYWVQSFAMTVDRFMPFLCCFSYFLKTLSD